MLQIHRAVGIAPSSGEAETGGRLSPGVADIVQRDNAHTDEPACTASQTSRAGSLAFAGGHSAAGA
jgi:hypothetical protein